LRLGKEYVHTIVRYGSAEERMLIGGIIPPSDSRKNAATQVSLLKSVQQALEERREQLSPG